MQTERESDIQKAILDYLSLKRIVAWRNNSGTAEVQAGKKLYWMKLAPKGSPDIIGYLPDGRFLGIEVKRKGGVASQEQIDFLDKLNNSGGLGMIAYSLDDVTKVM
jgi:hypothetical protein